MRPVHRVSTADQSLDNHRPDLQHAALARDMEVVEVFKEKDSATKARPEYERMMVATNQGRFTHLLIWALDRLG